MVKPTETFKWWSRKVEHKRNTWTQQKRSTIVHTANYKPLFLRCIFVSLISDSFSSPTKCKLLRDYFHLALLKRLIICSNKFVCNLSYIHLHIWKLINRQIIQYVNQANKLGRSVVRSFGRSVVRSFCHSVIRSFGSSVVLSFGHSVIRSFGSSVVRSFCHSVIRSFGHSVVRSFCHSVIRSFGRSVVRSFGRSVIRSFGRSVGQYGQTISQFTTVNCKPLFVFTHRFFSFLTFGFFISFPSSSKSGSPSSSLTSSLLATKSSAVFFYTNTKQKHRREENVKGF